MSSDPNIIRVRQAIRAPVDLIWQACASPHGLTNWQADEARGEARRGGRLTLHWAAFGATVELDVLDVVPYQRVLLGHGGSTVEFSLEEDAITLTQRGVDDADDADGLLSSWTVALAQLAHSVEQHPGRRRRVHWLVRHVPASAESIYLCCTDPLLLAHWLTATGGVPDAGQPYELWLKDGQHLLGRVLANVEGRDLALSCHSMGQALLTLRTLPSPMSASERILALAWSEWGGASRATAQLVDELDAALDRLLALLGRGGSA